MIRICVLTANNEPACFMDNDAPGSLHYYNDTLHTFLAGSAYTFEFTANAAHPDVEHLVVGNKLAFVDEDDRKYYLNISQTEQDEDQIMVTAMGLSFELINENAPTYEAESAMTFAQYMTAMGYNTAVIQIGTNEISNLSRTGKWESNTETRLARLFSLASLFDAELEFVPQLNKDYSLDKIILNVYRAHSDQYQGMGRVRDDVRLRYGIDISGITRKADLSNLYTQILPTGKDGLTISTKAATVYDDNGNVLYETTLGETTLRAVQARDQFPSNTSVTSDKYITYYWSTEYENVNDLYGNALAKLKEISKPAVEYEISGYADLNIGDTVTITDEAFNPSMYLEVRVTEQEVSFTEPQRNTTRFDNVTELTSQISGDLAAQIEALQAQVAAAQSTANSAASTASAAQSTAESAASSASTAQSTAEAAASAASSAASDASTALSTAQSAASDASDALVAAGQAAQDASDAADSASAAATSASTAAGQATSAANSASTAQTAAQTAEGHAQTASGAATAAQTQATNAANSASDASTAATAAQTQATNAATSASNAQTAAGQAAQDASDALTAAQAAQDAVDAQAAYFFHDSAGAHVTSTPDDATTGNNVLIDASKVDIRNGTNVVASFGSNKVELGKNNDNATIELCNGRAGFEYDVLAKQLKLAGQDYSATNLASLLLYLAKNPSLAAGYASALIMLGRDAGMTYAEVEADNVTITAPDDPPSGAGATVGTIQLSAKNINMYASEAAKIGAYNILSSSIFGGPSKTAIIGHASLQYASGTLLSRDVTTGLSSVDYVFATMAGTAAGSSYPVAASNGPPSLYVRKNSSSNGHIIICAYGTGFVSGHVFPVDWLAIGDP